VAGNQRIAVESFFKFLIHRCVLIPTHIMTSISKEAPSPVLQEGDVRDWQVELDEILNSQPENDRQIYFYNDPQGGKD